VPVPSCSEAGTAFRPKSDRRDTLVTCEALQSSGQVWALASSGKVWALASSGQVWALASSGQVCVPVPSCSEAGIAFRPKSDRRDTLVTCEALQSSGQV